VTAIDATAVSAREGLFVMLTGLKSGDMLRPHDARELAMSILKAVEDCNRQAQAGEARDRA
jgi:hypothetical protein